MNKALFFDEYFHNIPTDGLGYWLEWKLEINKWLEFFHTLNPVEYERNRTRVNRKSERDGFLGEIKSVYFIGNILKLKIAEFAPSNGNHDFSFKDCSGDSWQCEVKSPSWKAPVMKSETMEFREKLDRIKRPQYNSIDTEAGFLDPSKEILDAIDDPLKNTLEKKVQFKHGDNNLLIITPNMDQQVLIMIGINKMGGIDSLIFDEVKRRDRDGILSTVLILEPIIYVNNPSCTYHFSFIPISKNPYISGI